MRKLLVCLGLILIVLLVGCGGEPTATFPPPSTPETTAPPTETPPAETEPPMETTAPPDEEEADLILVKSWSGTGIKTTEPFTIQEKPWIVNWVNDPEIMGGQSVGMLQIMVFSEDDPDIPIDIVANTQEAGTDTSYIYEVGTFFLTMNAANTSWGVYVFKPE